MSPQDKEVYIARAEIAFGTDTQHTGISYNIFFSGCSKSAKCEGCHNPSLWQRDEDTKIALSIACDSIRQNADMIDAVVLLGGEPLDQPEAVIVLSQVARELGKKVWLYTGRAMAEVSDEIRAVSDNILSGEYTPNMAKIVWRG